MPLGGWFRTSFNAFMNFKVGSKFNKANSLWLPAGAWWFSYAGQGAWANHLGWVYMAGDTLILIAMICYSISIYYFIFIFYFLLFTIYFLFTISIMHLWLHLIYTKSAHHYLLLKTQVQDTNWGPVGTQSQSSDNTDPVLHHDVWTRKITRSPVLTRNIF